MPVHIALEPARDDDSRIEIVLTDGRRVHLTGLVNGQALVAVLEALALADAVATERRPC